MLAAAFPEGPHGNPAPDPDPDPNPTWQGSGTLSSLLRQPGQGVSHPEQMQG